MLGGDIREAAPERASKLRMRYQTYSNNLEIIFWAEWQTQLVNPSSEEYRLLRMRFCVFGALRRSGLERRGWRREKFSTPLGPCI